MEQKNILAQEEKIIRIASKDIAGNKTLYAGLTKIKGVSWAFSNAICNKLQLDKKEKLEAYPKKK
jgi:ribosomal protein S13